MREDCSQKERKKQFRAEKSHTMLKNAVSDRASFGLVGKELWSKN